MNDRCVISDAIQRRLICVRSANWNYTLLSRAALRRFPRTTAELLSRHDVCILERERWAIQALKIMPNGVFWLSPLSDPRIVFLRVSLILRYIRTHSLTAKSQYAMIIIMSIVRIATYI